MSEGQKTQHKEDRVGPGSEGIDLWGPKPRLEPLLSEQNLCQYFYS